MNSKTKIKLIKIFKKKKILSDVICYIFFFLSMFICKTFLMVKLKILILEPHSACELQFIEFCPVFIISCQSNILYSFLPTQKNILTLTV